MIVDIAAAAVVWSRRTSMNDDAEVVVVVDGVVDVVAVSAVAVRVAADVAVEASVAVAEVDDAAEVDAVGG